MPQNFSRHFAKYSRNIEQSYFAPSLDIGVGIESNLLYAPGSFIPRSIDFNLATALQGVSMNLVEVGARVEGFEVIVEKIFGPKGYLRTASFRDIISDIVKYAMKESHTITEEFQLALRQNNLIDTSFLSKFFSKIYCCGRSDVLKANIFARLLGQELGFASLSGNLFDLAPSNIYGWSASYINKIINELKNTNTNMAHAGQIDFDYTFPTIQGTPLTLKLQGTAVIGLSMEGNFYPPELSSNWRNGEKSMKLIPSLSAELQGFVGYETYLTKTGIKMSSNVTSSNGVSVVIKPKGENNVELQWGIPKKMELVNVRSETYLMKSQRGRPETRIIPSTMRDVRVKRQSCSASLDSTMGLQLCYEFNVPDIFRCNALPLGEVSIVNVYIKRSESGITGYDTNVSVYNEEKDKGVTVRLKTLGSTVPREATVTLAYTREAMTYLLSGTLEAPDISSELWSAIFNGEEKAADTYLSFKSNEVQLTEGVKVVFNNVSRPNYRELVLNMYSSKNRNYTEASQILEFRSTLESIGPEVSVEFAARTRNALRNFINLTTEGIIFFHPVA